MNGVRGEVLLGGGAGLSTDGYESYFLAAACPDSCRLLVPDGSQEKHEGAERDTHHQADGRGPVATAFANLHQTKQLLTKLRARKKLTNWLTGSLGLQPDT